MLAKGHSDEDWCPLSDPSSGGSPQLRAVPFRKIGVSVFPLPTPAPPLGEADAAMLLASLHHPAKMVRG